MEKATNGQFREFIGKLLVKGSDAKIALLDRTKIQNAIDSLSSSDYVFNNFIEGTKVPHEGIVIKHQTGERQKIAKVINPDYLIYSEKHNVGDSH